MVVSVSLISSSPPPTPRLWWKHSSSSETIFLALLSTLVSVDSTTARAQVGLLKYMAVRACSTKNRWVLLETRKVDFVEISTAGSGIILILCNDKQVRVGKEASTIAGQEVGLWEAL